ncbi:hypothetical protein [Streptomyces sp. LUP30]|nr:hypothetical protein [Streptomyces sp. LUP30]
MPERHGPERLLKIVEHDAQALVERDVGVGVSVVVMSLQSGVAVEGRRA